MSAPGHEVRLHESIRSTAITPSCSCGWVGWVETTRRPADQTAADRATDQHDDHVIAATRGADR